MYPDDSTGALTRFVEESAVKLDQAPELFGPTDINAQSSNGRLAVGLNDAGTVTVLRWPRPSFYDQLKYHTLARDEPRFGVAPNEGAFLGLRFHSGDSTETEWLREWATTQRYDGTDTDAVVTTHRSERRGLTATVVDVVARERDAFARTVTVERETGDAPERADLLAFENLNLVVSKEAGNPVQDWAREDENTDTARYDPATDAVIHRKSGVDASTGRERSVAVGMGFDRASTGHQVGGDAHEPAAADGAGDAPDGGEGAGSDDGPPLDAYEAATAGALPGDDAYTGQTTGALATPLDLEDGADTATVIFAGGGDGTAVRDTLATARERGPDDRREAKREWLADLVGDAPMPETDDEAILAVCRRALVTLVTNYDPESGAIVAGIATQSPYNLDWVRDGAYFNHALGLLGLDEWVERRNRWYADLQQGFDGYRIDLLGVPVGNWTMNYYADGVPGGHIDWEIDQTGYGVWTLYDHYAVTGDEAYLRDVWPAIERAAEFLTAFRDPETGLPYPAHEDDHLLPSQTAVGAAAVRLGLTAATRAAEALGADEAAARYADRRAELDEAIERHLWDEDEDAYSASPLDTGSMAALPLVADPEAEPTLGWPARYRAPEDDRMRRHLERLWATLEPTFDEPGAGERGFGQYEVKGLVTLARAWQGDEAAMDRVREGVRWVAHEHATDDTHVMGELWLLDGGEVETSVSQPHTWEQLLFYYAALEAFPPEEVDVPTDGWTGVVDRLRERG